MSPEQLSGVRALIDEKSDVWGLGALLFEVLTGSSPRESGPLTRPPPAVRTLVPECPTDLAALCDKALAESRDERYPSAEALAADLDAWLHGRPVTAHVYRPAELARRFVAEHRIALLVAVVSLASLVVLSVGAFLRLREERNRAREFGLSMLADVVPRMTSLGDARFLTRLTGRVQEWLDAAGSGEDDAAVAHTWMQLAVNANYLVHKEDAERFAQRCLAVTRGLPLARDRYALEQTCEATRVDNDPALNESERTARFAELWRTSPPPDAINDARTVEARERLAMRRFTYANNLVDGPEEASSIREALALCRRWEDLDPGDPAARVAHVEALINAAVAASNEANGAAALQFSTESVQQARALLAITRSEQALGRLSDALVMNVTTRRWYGNDEPAARARVEAEARDTLHAQLVLSPDSVPAAVGLLDLLLETADLEALPAALTRVKSERLERDGRAMWLYAMLASGQSRQALGQRAWLKDDPQLDTWLSFALLAADTGDWKQAATWVREAEQRPAASVWMIAGLHRWASLRTGEGAPAIQRFEAAMSTAQRQSDDAAIHQAMLQFADDLERLAAR